MSQLGGSDIAGINDPGHRKRIAIVGGGLSGLSAAYQTEQEIARLRLPWSVHLFEAGDRLGGLLATEVRDGYLVEQSADMFVSEPPDAVELVEELGQSDQLVATEPVQPSAYIAWEDRLHPVPAGWALLQPAKVLPVLTSGLFSWEGKARIFRERFVRSTGDGRGDLSLAEFARRRFGREAFERLIQPLASGIYTADPQRLSMQATMQRFLSAELEQGSLWAAGSESHAASDSGARYRLFRAPREGMGSLVRWLRNALQTTEVHLHTRVTEVAPCPDSDRWILSTGQQRALFDGVILSTPAAQTAASIELWDPELASHMGEMPAASSAVVMIAADQEQFSRPCPGFGVLFPSIAGRPLIACSFASHKFSGRAPAGKVLIRAFLGGALAPAEVDRESADLVDTVIRELRSWFGFSGQPEWTDVVRWRQAMPQYHLGHREVAARIRKRIEQWPGFALAGNSYAGVGIPFCIRSGRQASRAVCGQLRLADG